jgi:hypothetical protein
MVQPEWLDELTPQDPRAARSRRDIQRINLIAGNDRTMAQGLNAVFDHENPQHIVEIGAGNGHFFLSVARRIKSKSAAIDVILLDRVDGIDREVCAELKQLGWNAAIEIADAINWLRENSLKLQAKSNVIIANQFFHQFEPDALGEIIRLAANAAAVLIAVEPRREILPLICSRMVGLIGCGAVTRYDAPVSVRAGFRDDEISAFWPNQNTWQLTERRAGMFSHLFIARRKG